MSGSFKVLALDPGGTTGWASFSCQVIDSVDENGQPEVLEARWNCGQIGPKEHHLELYHFLGMQQVKETVIVCESFEFRNRVRPGTELISNEYIGITKLFARERRVPIYFQTASQGKITSKSFVKKDNLQKLGVYVPGFVHAMDSYGHLLYWIICGKAPVWLKDALVADLLEKGWR